MTPGGKAPADARLGRLETPDGTVNPVVRLEEVTLEEIDGVTRFTRKKKGKSLGALWAGSKLDGVVMRGGQPGRARRHARRGQGQGEARDAHLARGAADHDLAPARLPEQGPQDDHADVGAVQP